MIEDQTIYDALDQLESDLREAVASVQFPPIVYELDMVVFVGPDEEFNLQEIM